uniref:Uncharacterized protein n=1 Tax=Romanomermis culicivorax TaxID=13658 RepID=A0A915K6M4_ROMCU
MKIGKKIKLIDRQLEKISSYS